MIIQLLLKLRRAASGLQLEAIELLTEDESMTGMMQMMRRLMQERNIEVKQTIETTIAQHIQCLNKAIAQEKIAMYRRST